MPTTRLVLLPGMDGTGLLFEPLLGVLPHEWEPIVVRYSVDEALGYDALIEVVKAVSGREGESNWFDYAPDASLLARQWRRRLAVGETGETHGTVLSAMGTRATRSFSRPPL